MMDNNPQIEMLQEMGFSEAQALEALSASGHDLNKAIAYLFGETDGNSGAGTQQSPFEVDAGQTESSSSISISNPHEIPEFLGSYASNTPVDGVRHYERPISEDSVAPSMESFVNKDYKENIGDNGGEYSAETSSSSSMEDIPASLLEASEYPENVKTEFTNVPFLLTRQRDIKCWAPFLLILANSPLFAKKVLGLESDSRFVQEVQRLVYFVQNFDSSNRWFLDTDEISDILGNEGPRGAYGDEEMVLNMVDYLMKQEPALKPVFESMVQSLDEEINKELTVLEIDSDSRGSTLYETLNELFWQRDFEFLGRIKYSSVAPIVTYQLVADSGAKFSPFSLSETIYPEIYSDKSLDRIQQEIHSIKRAHLEYQASNRKLMDLNFFEGKKIDGLLSQTASALRETNPGASDDIKELTKMVHGLRVVELESQNRAKDHASPKRLTSFEGIIDDIPGLRPYTLIGVILAESRYFLRKAEQWIDMEAGVTVDFASVSRTVESCACPHLITLIYGDASENGEITMEEETGEDCEKSGDIGESEKSEELEENEKPKNSEENEKSEKSEKNVKSPQSPDVSENPQDPEISDGSQNGAAASGNTSHTGAAENAKLGPSAPAHGRVNPAHTKAGIPDETVKRPRWAESGTQETEHPQSPDPRLPDSVPKVVRVSRNVVRRFLQDEEKSPNVAL